MKLANIFLLLSFCIVACNEPKETELLGSWRLDSVYDYHNGFTFTNRDPYPKEVHEYKNDKTMIRKGMGEQLEYHYSCVDSILKLTGSAGNPSGEFIIVQLDDNRLALKENKKPMFQSKNEVRYEIRFFSKTDSLETGR